MMFKNDLVCCIKVNGSILRERNNTVSIPFGSEYTVLLKNLNSVRAQFKLSIDGTDATNGTWIIISPNSSVEMERFIQNGNWERGNKFKFIERTEAVEAHRGVGAEDGLIRVEWKKELVRPIVPRPIYEDYYPTFPDRRKQPWIPKRTTYLRSAMKSASASRGVTGQSVNSMVSNLDNSLGAETVCSSFNDAGITVPGSISNQRFVQGEYFETEITSQVMILHLKGKVGGKHIQVPLTVKSKPICTSCGKSNRSNAEYCSRCGTSLCIVA